MMRSYIHRLILPIIAFSVLMFAPATLAIDCTTCSDPSKSQNLSTSEAIQCGTSCASGNNQDAAQATNTANDTVKNIVNLLSAAVGAIAVIMIIVAGVRYTTSGGKDDAVKSAKNTIVYALAGLVVVALAQLMVHFVLNKTTDSLNGKTGNTTSGVSEGALNSPH